MTIFSLPPRFVSAFYVEPQCCHLGLEVLLRSSEVIYAARPNMGS